MDCRDRKQDVTIPKIDNIHQKVYEAASQENALNMDSWHTCETTHCRAGWVVHLAGEKGKKLERMFNTPMAALMIYKESSNIKVGLNEFYKDNEKALENMKELAEREGFNNIKKITKQTK